MYLGLVAGGKRKHFQRNKDRVILSESTMGYEESGKRYGGMIMVDWLTRCCVKTIEFLILLGLIILKPLMWLLVKTKLIFPVAYFIVYSLVDKYNPLGLAGFLNAGIGHITMGNVGFVAVIFLSAAALLKEIIQAFKPDFTWSGLIRKERGEL